MLNHEEVNIVFLSNGLLFYIITLLEMPVELQYIIRTLPIQKRVG